MRPVFLDNLKDGNIEYELPVVQRLFLYLNEDQVKLIEDSFLGSKCGAICAAAYDMQLDILPDS